MDKNGGGHRAPFSEAAKAPGISVPMMRMKHDYLAEKKRNTGFAGESRTAGVEMDR
jgi:hypothetical protein